jgi:4-amino-4-deoxy-L-arabinose transferase-like glycosyltransferase
MKDERAPASAVWWKRDDVFAAALVAAALIPRLYVALAWASEPVWDGHYYDFGARRIAEGFGYSDDRSVDGALVWHPWCHYPVGYSAFLALFYRLFGATHAVAGLVNACIGAALAVVTWRLSALALSPVRARAAGLLVALHPGLVLYSALVMSEPLAALATLTAFWVATRDARSGNARRGIALGALVLGLGALVRPQALLCAPFLGLVILKERQAPRDPPRLGRALAAASIACVLALVPVLPWTARNCRVMDGCALVSTNAGWNLAIGAFPRATGRFETLRSSDGCREVTGQVQQDRCWLDYGVEQIRAAPRHWLALVPAKLGYTFDHESFAVEYLREARPDAWPEARRVAVRDVTTMFHRLLVCAAALGCVAFRVRGKGAATQGVLLAMVLALAYVGFSADAPTFWPLAVFAAVVPWVPLPGRAEWGAAMLLPLVLLGTTIVTHAVFFGEDRYHVVVTPVLCMLAAGALRRSRSAGKA